MISFVLNLPYTIIGLLCALLSMPTGLRFITKPFALVFNVKSFWWQSMFIKGVRASTFGSVIMLGPKLKAGDLQHEHIHVKQYNAMPIVFPILYSFELLLNGYKNNKYEIEACNYTQYENA